MARRSDRPESWRRRAAYPRRWSSRVFGKVWSPHLTQPRTPTMTAETSMNLRSLLERNTIPTFCVR